MGISLFIGRLVTPYAEKAFASLDFQSRGPSNRRKRSSDLLTMKSQLCTSGCWFEIFFFFIPIWLKPPTRHVFLFQTSRAVAGQHWKVNKEIHFATLPRFMKVHPAAGVVALGAFVALFKAISSFLGGIHRLFASAVPRLFLMAHLWMMEWYTNV